MIFGMWNSEKIWHENLTHCPPRLSDVATVPWEIDEKSFSTVLFIHTSDYLHYLTRKQSNPLAHPTWNITTLTCELQNFFIRLKLCCVLSDVGGSEKSQLWVVVGGSEKNQLLRVAAEMSGKPVSLQVFRLTTVCVNSCFQSFSTSFSRVVHHTVLQFSPWRNKPLP